MKGKKILLGVSGGIAAYKACSLMNHLFKEGADVKVIMTPAATKFVSPLTFQALSNHPVYMDMFKTINHEEVEHISLAKWADLAVIAPATANTIGKIAHGLADNLLTTVVMALPAKIKVVIAPAMNVEMWHNPLVQRNVKILEEMKNKYVITGTREGVLACRDKGEGKIADTKTILDLIKKTI